MDFPLPRGLCIFFELRRGAVVFCVVIEVALALGGLLCGEDSGTLFRCSIRGLLPCTRPEMRRRLRGILHPLKPKRLIHTTMVVLGIIRPAHPQKPRMNLHIHRVGRHIRATTGAFPVYRGVIGGSLGLLLLDSRHPLLKTMHFVAEFLDLRV